MCVLGIPGTSTIYNKVQCKLKQWPLHARRNRKLGVIQSQSGFRRAKSLIPARDQTMISQSPSPLPSHQTNYNTLTPCQKRKTSTSQNYKSFNVTKNSIQIYTKPEYKFMYDSMPSYSVQLSVITNRDKYTYWKAKVFRCILYSTVQGDMKV